MKNINIEEFKELFINQLKNKEYIIEHFQITDYLYRTIIKDFGLIRSKTSKMNRIKTENNIEIVKKDYDPNAKGERNAHKEPKEPKEPKINENTEAIQIIKIDNIANKKGIGEDLKQSIKEKLEASKKNRNKK
jgi:hypothetical protein